jgi:hypothetical protein
MNQIQRDHIIPLPEQKMLKFDGLLGTYSPALATAGAFGHIMPECSPAVLIIKTQGRSRTIFDTRQANITLTVYTKVTHSTLHLNLQIFC